MKQKLLERFALISLVIFAVTSITAPVAVHADSGSGRGGDSHDENPALQHNSGPGNREQGNGDRPVGNGGTIQDNSGLGNREQGNGDRPVQVEDLVLESLSDVDAAVVAIFAAIVLPLDEDPDGSTVLDGLLADFIQDLVAPFDEAVVRAVPDAVDPDRLDDLIDGFIEDLRQSHR